MSDTKANLVRNNTALKVQQKNVVNNEGSNVYKQDMVQGLCSEKFKVEFFFKLRNKKLVAMTSSNDRSSTQLHTNWHFTNWLSLGRKWQRKWKQAMPLQFWLSQPILNLAIFWMLPLHFAHGSPWLHKVVVGLHFVLYLEDNWRNNSVWV